MPCIITMPSTYQMALKDLARAQCEAQELAELLDCFAGLLRGARSEFPGPPLDLCPGVSRLQRALEQRDRAREEANRVYRLLPADAQELFLSPEEQLTSQ